MLAVDLSGAALAECERGKHKRHRRRHYAHCQQEFSASWRMSLVLICELAAHQILRSRSSVIWQAGPYKYWV